MSDTDHKTYKLQITLQIVVTDKFEKIIRGMSRQ